MSQRRHKNDPGTIAQIPAIHCFFIDHAASKKGDVIVPTVTGKVYNHSKRMKEKRAVLDGVAAELRRIIGKPASAEHAETQMRLAA